MGVDLGFGSPSLNSGGDFQIQASGTQYGGYGGGYKSEEFTGGHKSILSSIDFDFKPMMSAYLPSASSPHQFAESYVVTKSSVLPPPPVSPDIERPNQSVVRREVERSSYLPIENEDEDYKKNTISTEKGGFFENLLPLVFLSPTYLDVEEKKRREKSRPEVLVDIKPPKPDFDIGLSIPKPSFDLPRYEAPKYDFEIPKPSFELPKFDAPKFDIDLPKFEAPKFDFEAPKFSFDLPKFEAPKASFGLPNFDLPKYEPEPVSFNFHASLPTLSMEKTSKPPKAKTPEAPPRLTEQVAILLFGFQENGSIFDL